MRIVINAALLPEMYAEDYVKYFSETFKQLTKKYIEHQFIFICEEQTAELFSTGSNVDVHVIKARRTNALTWKYWYDVRIPLLLRKYKASLFLSPGGFCSLGTKLPQCLIVNDLFFLESPSFFSRATLHFYRKRIRKSVVRAKGIISFSQLTADKLIQDYGLAAAKIQTVPVTIPAEYRPQDDAVKESTKARYAGGKEYFLYTGLLHPSRNLVQLLKAFSLFKKRQQSSMKLIICGNGTGNDPSLVTLLKTYKYRDDVSLTGQLPLHEKVQLMASAYALVYPVAADDFSLPVMEAMLCDVPVITSENSAMQEITAGAAIYVDPGNPQQVAEAMMRLYKDENGRKELLVKGRQVAAQNITADPAGRLWQALQAALL